MYIYVYTHIHIHMYMILFTYYNNDKGSHLRGSAHVPHPRRAGGCSALPAYIFMDVQTYPKRFLPEPFEAY